MIRPKENICMCSESVNELLNSVLICFLYLLFNAVVFFCEYTELKCLYELNVLYVTDNETCFTHSLIS